MPLMPGDSQTTIGHNISEMVRAGHPQKVAVAASLENARRHPHAAIGGGLGSPHLHFQGGGFSSFSADSPWWTRNEARQTYYDSQLHGGLIASSGAGRTDQIPASVQADSHVIPAQEIAGLGQGNTLSGARILSAALHIGPYGTELPRAARGPGPRRAPSVSPREMGLGYAGGGRPANDDHANDNHDRDKTSVLVAGGEFHIPASDWIARDEHGQPQLYAGVKTLGKGDIREGHKTLNDMIMNIRDDTLKFLKHAPPPKK